MVLGCALQSLTFLSKTSAYVACIRDMYNERWTQDLHRHPVLDLHRHPVLDLHRHPVLDLHRHPVLCIWSWSALLSLNKIPSLLYEQLCIYTTILCL